MAGGAQPAGGYPEMMKLPPKFPFYPRHLQRYEGVGSVSGARVARNLAICFGASLGLFFFIRSRLESSRPAPASLSDEWVKATEERAKRLNADPISRHKIGQPVADPAKVNEELIKIITKTED